MDSLKRIFALLLVLCLILCSCGTPQETTPSTEATQPTTEATQPTTEATEATTQPTEPPVLFRHPLNGAPLDAPFAGRVTAVVINNLVDCLPQYGISQADMIYEVETEGSITRLLALFSQLEDVDTIGPVRSGRTYYNSIALSYDAPIIHCGGSRGGLYGLLDDAGTSIDNWAHINEQFNGSYFFRDKDRYNYQGYSWEHTLFTKGELLLKGLSDKGYNTVTELDFGLQFDDQPQFSGDPANVITVTFKGGKTTTMTYDSETGVYKAAQYKRDHMDAGTEQVMAYRNVLALYTSQWGIYDGQYTRSFYDLIGSGSGHFACDGKLIPILWSRESARAPFCYTLEDGTPLTLGTGTTYVGIIGGDRTVSYE